MRRKTERRERLRKEKQREKPEQRGEGEKATTTRLKKRKVWRIVKTKRQTEGGEET